jgi:hypothetical protein
MSQPSQPSPASPGRRFTIPFGIPACWTSDQALAVVELLDDLRELIWAHYGVRLIDLIQAEQVGPQTEIDPTASTDEVDF